MHYSPNGPWSINNAYDIHDSTNIDKGSLIACGFVCVVHGSTHIVHNSINGVRGSTSIDHGSTPQIIMAPRILFKVPYRVPPPRDHCSWFHQ